MKLTLTPLPGIPLVQPGDDLAALILDGCRRADIALQDGDVLVLAQKIVSKAEGRLVNLADVSPSSAARELAARSEKDPRLCELILRESNEVLRVRPGLVIVEHKLGFVCANAGIDHSNVSPPVIASERERAKQSPSTKREIASATSSPRNDRPDEWYLLLPKDPDASADRIRAALEAASGARLGVQIIDSHGRAWREGTVGVTIGLSGLPALMDERGWKDLFGYELRVTVVGVADELAAAASLMMGQAAEGTPVVHARGFPYPLAEGRLKDLLRPKEKDLFR